MKFTMHFKTRNQLKSDLRGIETKLHHHKKYYTTKLKSDLRGIETSLPKTR